MAKKGLCGVLMAMLVPMVAFVGLLATAVAATPAGGNQPVYLPLIVTEGNPPSDDPDWLTYVNGFRTASGLTSLSENSEWSQGAWLHGRYMVKNDIVTHSEDPANAWYTVEGADAADSGNVVVSSQASADFESAINWWLRAPFHGLAILDPQLQMTGFGIYTETASTGGSPDWKMGATFDVERGRGALPAGTTFPITFPADGGSIPFTTYSGNEYPDPLKSCPGYDEPVGLPLIIQVGEGDATINVTNSTLTEDGNNIDHCIFDETTYNSSDTNEQTIGRLVLSSRDAVIIVPRNPLQVGSTYVVTITNDGMMHSWSFTVAASKEAEVDWTNFEGR